MDPVACLCANLRRAALALTSLYDDALAPYGLKVTQFSLLRAIQRHGEPNLTQLAEATGGPAFATCVGLLHFAASERAESPRQLRAIVGGEGPGLISRVGTWLRENF